MNTPEILAAMMPIVEALEELGVAYHIGGSVASSIYGIHA
jgi:di/tricarboxylate transporter